MKVYVNREEVIKLCEQFGVMALKKRIEELPVTKIIPPSRFCRRKASGCANPRSAGSSPVAPPRQ